MWRILLAVLTLVGVGCTGATAQSEQSEASTAPAESETIEHPAAATTTDTVSTQTVSIHDAVLAAVEGFGRSTITVNDPPDPTHPDLARFRTGEVLTNALAAVTSNEQLGIAYRFPPGRSYTHRATVVLSTDVRAVVRDCVVDGAAQVAVSDGRTLNDVVATKLFDTTLVMVDGAWKVSANALVDRWEGVGGCAAAGSS